MLLCLESNVLNVRFCVHIGKNNCDKPLQRALEESGVSSVTCLRGPTVLKIVKEVLSFVLVYSWMFACFVSMNQGCIS